MKIKDLVFESNHSKFDINIINNGSVVTFKAIARDDVSTHVGTLTVDDFTIKQIDIDQEAKHKNDAFFELLKAVCAEADKQNKVLIVDTNSFKKPSDKRRYEQFGFHVSEDDYMERRPGSVLPLAFI